MTDGKAFQFDEDGKLVLESEDCDGEIYQVKIDPETFTVPSEEVLFNLTDDFIPISPKLESVSSKKPEKKGGVKGFFAKLFGKK